jgi:hypothetical protein
VGPGPPSSSPQALAPQRRKLVACLRVVARAGHLEELRGARKIGGGPLRLLVPMVHRPGNAHLIDLRLAQRAQIRMSTPPAMVVLTLAVALEVFELFLRSLVARIERDGLAVERFGVVPLALLDQAISLAAPGAPE